MRSAATTTRIGMRRHHENSTAWGRVATCTMVEVFIHSEFWLQLVCLLHVGDGAQRQQRRCHRLAVESDGTKHLASTPDVQVTSAVAATNQELRPRGRQHTTQDDTAREKAVHHVHEQCLAGT